MEILITEFSEFSEFSGKMDSKQNRWEDITSQFHHVALTTTQD